MVTVWSWERLARVRASILEYLRSHGPVTPLTDLGDPVNTDDYALYIYDAGTLVTSAEAPHGGTCRGRPCWTGWCTT